MYLADLRLRRYKMAADAMEAQQKLDDEEAALAAEEANKPVMKKKSTFGALFTKRSSK